MNVCVITATSQLLGNYTHSGTMILKPGDSSHLQEESSATTNKKKSIKRFDDVMKWPNTLRLLYSIKKGNEGKCQHELIS